MDRTDVCRVIQYGKLGSVGVKLFKLFEAKCSPSQMALPFPHHMDAESLLVAISGRDCSQHTGYVR
jgi:hypothetical protein